MIVEQHAVAPLQITSMIHVIRRQRVMLDEDLATLYQTSTGRLNEQVKRNRHRFPPDFMFQLTREEYKHLISHVAISKIGRGGRRKLPFAFTEHGAVMLASVLNSRTAVEASIQVVRAFIQLRNVLSSHADLACQLQDLEARYDSQFQVVFDAIRELMRPVEADEVKQIGFRSATDFFGEGSS